MRHDLREAFDELQLETIQATVISAADEQSYGYATVCTLCGSPPTNKDKLRYCGRCAAVHYCSKHCAKEHWAEHKLMCARLRKARAKALADHVARGGQKQDFNQITLDGVKWCMAVPGLLNDIQLLAWAHRCESPLIHAIATSGSDADGSDIRVEMMALSTGT
jgi:hypothetical protein